MQLVTQANQGARTQRDKPKDEDDDLFAEV
jgi:hypothetical protein